MRYSPSMEQAEAHEGKRSADLRALMRHIRETTHRLTGHVHRSLHAKSHALLEGRLEVEPNLPPELAQGLFATSGSYPVILRLSSNRGDILDDDIGVPRGLALKVIGVEGARLPGSESNATQDFVLVNQPFFTEPDLRVFRRNMRVVDATTHTGLLWKKALAAALRPVVAAARSLGRTAPTLTTMGGHPLSHPLGDTYFSQVPFRHGEHVAKYALVPVSPELRRLKGRRVAMRGRPNALREACIAHFLRHGGVWELRAQLRTNPRTMPVENAATEWSEDESPYRTVARLTVEPQPAWSEARARIVDDGLSFSPWHGLVAHRPLGAINRARLVAYEEAARDRAARQGCPLREPNRRLELPADPPQVFGTAPGREGKRPRTPDAVPGAWEAPMKPMAPVVMAGVAGALLGGVALAVTRPGSRRHAEREEAARRAIAAEAAAMRAQLERVYPAPRRASPSARRAEPRRVVEAEAPPPRREEAERGPGWASQLMAMLAPAVLPVAAAASAAPPGQRAAAALGAASRLGLPAAVAAAPGPVGRSFGIVQAFRDGFAGAPAPLPGAALLRAFISRP
jgi:hypothetical protein